MALAQPATEFSTLAVHDAVLVVTLNRAKNLNALHPPASRELARVWDWFDAHADLRVAIITGSGRLFCAGFDLQWYNQNPDYQLTGLDGHGFGGLTNRKLKKPVIAAVNGPAFGGGFELALSCDLIVASTGANFALSEPRVGLAALGSGLVRLPLLVGYQRALEVILTGEPILAEKAHDMGIVNAVVQNDNLTPYAMKLARKIVECSPDSIIASKAIVNLAMDEGITRALERQGTLKEVKAMMEGENRFEGIRAFNEKRKPQWKPSKL